MKAKFILLFVLSISLINVSPAQGKDDTLRESLLRDVPTWMAEYKVPCVGIGLIDGAG